jgi:hypothetical protein
MNVRKFRLLSLVLVAALALALTALPATAFAKLALTPGLLAGPIKPTQGARSSVSSAAMPLAGAQPLATPTLPTRSNLVSTIPLEVVEHAEFPFSGVTRLDAIIYNSNNVGAKDVQGYVTWYDASDNEVATQAYDARCSVIPASDWATFVVGSLVAPPGATYYELSADGVPCAAPAVYLSCAFAPGTNPVMNADGTRHYFITVTNNRAYTVNNINPSSYEFQAPYLAGTTDPDMDNAVLLDVPSPGGQLAVDADSRRELYI